jgi:hypothetical protein
MRELVPENAGGKVNPSQNGSRMFLVDKELVCPGQPFPKRCEGWKCKDRARREESLSTAGALQIRRSWRPTLRKAARA